MNLNLFIYGEVQKYVGLRNKLHLTVGCMRGFALMNFQINTNADNKLSYTPC